jgi:DHA1 family bicyclomycin/chloramphenicol resistance-like MFS transporter
MSVPPRRAALPRFVLIDGYGISPERYALYGRRLLQRWPPVRVMVGAAALCSGGALAFAGAIEGELGPLGLIAPMLVYCAGVGLTFPSATAVALEPVAEIAGMASAILGSLQMITGALAGYLTTLTGGRDPHTLGAVLALAGTFALVLAVRRERFSR